MATKCAIKLKRTIGTMEELPLKAALIFLVIYEFLPVLRVLPPILLSFFRTVSVGVFYIYVLKRDFNLAIKFIAISCIAFVVHLWGFYHCWITYTGIGGYMLKNVICWVYMQIGLFLILYGSQDIKIAIRNTIIALVVITAVTSMISLMDTPTAVRELANGSKHIAGMESALYARNTSTWGCLYGMTFLLPYIIFLYRKNKNPILIFVTIIIEACIIKSQITMAIIISFLFLVFMALKPLSPKWILGLGSFFIAIFAAISTYLGDFFLFIYEMVSKTNNSVLKLRAYQIYVLFAERSMVGTVEGRFALYTASLKTFLENSLFGFKITNEEAYTAIGMHSQILDMMAAVGIVGFVPLAVFFFYLVYRIGSIIRRVDEMRYRYFFITMIVLVGLMILNPTYYAEAVFLAIFIGGAVIVPLKE